VVTRLEEGEQSAEQRRMDEIGRSLPTQYNGMNTINNRLRTFINWPISHIVTPQSLAEAGFFYQHVSDRVKCAFCIGGIHNWVDGDTALGEHRRLFPNCRYLKQLDNKFQPPTTNTTSTNQCVVCMNQDIDCLFLPCRHVVCCKQCGQLLQSCAVCRKPIGAVLKVFLP